MRWTRRTSALDNAENTSAAVTAVAGRGQQTPILSLEQAKASLGFGGRHRAATLRPEEAVGAPAVGSLAMGAVATGAPAVGASAVGCLSGSRARIGTAEIGRLRIEALKVDAILTPSVADHRECGRLGAGEAGA